MAHARTTIREAMVAALTGLTTTGSRVRDTDAYPRGGDDLPDLVVETLGEEVAAGALDDCAIRETLVTLTARVKAISGGAATIDTIDTESSVALYTAFANGSLTGALSIDWVSFELEREVSEEKPIFKSEITYRVKYEVDAANPASAVT